jgi:mono/diheme cytochrome c family protein
VNFGLAAALALAVAANSAAGAPYPDVSAILNAHCIVCHQGEAAPLGLRLDSHAALMRGSSRGPVVRPGKPGES